jgi:hypothetical protein
MTMIEAASLVLGKDVHIWQSLFQSAFTSRLQTIISSFFRNGTSATVERVDVCEYLSSYVSHPSQANLAELETSLQRECDIKHQLWNVDTLVLDASSAPAAQVQVYGPHHLLRKRGKG